MMFSKIFEKIKKSNKIAIFSHTRPDGDTIGGVLALKIALQSIGKTCDTFCDVAISEKFFFLPQADQYQLAPQQKDDLYIAVDCGERARLGENYVYFNNKNDKIDVKTPMKMPRMRQISKSCRKFSEFYEYFEPIMQEIC